MEGESRGWRGSGKTLGAGAVAGILLGLLLGLAVTPAEVVVLTEGGEQAPRLVDVAPGIYWLNVIGFTSWFTLLGLSATLIGILLRRLWRSVGRQKRP